MTTYHTTDDTHVNIYRYRGTANKPPVMYGYAYRITKNDGTEHSGFIDDVNDLCAVLRRYPPTGPYLQVVYLPTFGGDVPDNPYPSIPYRVWSWDRDRVLVGETWRDVEVMPRHEWESWTRYL